MSEKQFIFCARRVRSSCDRGCHLEVSQRTPVRKRTIKVQCAGGKSWGDHRLEGCGQRPPWDVYASLAQWWRLCVSDGLAAR